MFIQNNHPDGCLITGHTVSIHTVLQHRQPHYNHLSLRVTQVHKLDYLEIHPSEDADALVIWLHGLGANGYDFKAVVEQLELPTGIKIHFVLPHAPILPVTINQGMPMNAWYDIYSLEDNSKEDERGILCAMQSIEHLIAENFSHIPAQRIIIAGFSQGGAVALHTYLHSDTAIGGVIALSTYLPLSHLCKQYDSSNNTRKYIFMAHGESDEILTLDVAHRSRAALEAIGAEIEWHQYPMAHNLCTQEVADLNQWLIKRLST